MGFTFDDTNPVASPVSRMKELLRDEMNQEIVSPYLGGAEVNTSPTHAHHRYVIDFGERTLEEAARWPELLQIVEDKVHPERIGKPGSYSSQWWLFGRRNIEGTATVRNLVRVLVISRVSQTAAFTFLPPGMVYSEQLVVFGFEQYAAFAIMQCQIHEIWARFFSSSMKDDLRYAPTDCFETFAFPEGGVTNSGLEDVGEKCFNYRARLMANRSVRASLMKSHPEEGLTKTYNRFHDPKCKLPGVIKLRQLHSEMDRAVLDAYGWKDIPTDCDFYLDYPIDEATWGKKKKPYRYRWPDEVHDEVLARLLDLNQKRAEEERLAGVTSGGKKRGTRKKKTAKKRSDSATMEMFGKKEN